MNCRRTAGPPLAVILGIALLPLGGCGRKPPGGLPVIAVLPFDNLTSSRDLDWFAAAGSTLLVYGLYGQPGFFAVNTPTTNEAVAAHATSLLHTSFSWEGGGLTVAADVEDSATQRVTRHESFRVPATPEGALMAIGVLERLFAAHARMLERDAAPALVPFGRALNSVDAAEQAPLLEEAVRIAPDFIPAWLSRIELDAERHSAEAVDDIEVAMHSADGLDRARLECLRATLAGDSAGQIRAFTELTRRAPSDAGAARRLGELQTSARNFPAAAAAWGSVVKLQPWNESALNQLGYCRGWARDYNGAARAFAEYEALVPQDPNPPDSLGEVQFFFGHYRDAEASFLRSDQRDPAFFGGLELLKAAQARLLSGDRGGADGLYAKYSAWRRDFLHDALAPLERAQWDFLAGRRRQAMSELGAAAPQLEGDGRSRAESQLAFWLYASGDQAGARSHSDEALHQARTPASQATAAMCRFLSMPPASAPEWASRGDTVLRTAPANFRESALGYALVLDGHAAEAIPLLEQVLAAAAPGDDGEQRAMLASALLAAGRRNDANRLLWPMPIPLSSTPSTFAALTFPRWLEWTGESDKFRAFSGDLHLRFE